jgi:Ca2+:H+ antiporter
MMGAEKFGLGMEPDEEEVELTTPTVTTPRKMRSLDFQHIGSLAAVAESLSPGSRWRRALTSLRVVIFQAKINVLLPFGPLAVLLHHLTGNHVSFLLRSRIGSYLATLLT